MEGTVNREQSERMPAVFQLCILERSCGEERQSSEG